MTPILWISPGHDDPPTLTETAKTALKRGWVPIASPANWEGVAASLAMIDRLDPDLDAVLLMPGYVSSHAALQERDRADVRGIEVFRPLVSPECLPDASSRSQCKYYVQGQSAGLCQSDRARCPKGKTCPIRRRCQ